MAKGEKVLRTRVSNLKNNNGYSNKKVVSMRSNRRLLEVVLSFCPLRCSFCVPVHRQSEGKISASRLLLLLLCLGRGPKKTVTSLPWSRDRCGRISGGKTEYKSRLLDSYCDVRLSVYRRLLSQTEVRSVRKASRRKTQCLRGVLCFCGKRFSSIKKLSVAG